jgi:outer membrane receptor for ferrienterochelin and colicin
LEFGRFDDTIDYMLVANIITRKIHAKWHERAENYLTSKDKSDKPTTIGDYHTKKPTNFSIRPPLNKRFLARLPAKCANTASRFSW